jgi:hypothetical protein
VLTQAFDDCVSIYARFKLLDSFDSLLERPLIQVSQPGRAAVRAGESCG